MRYADDSCRSALLQRLLALREREQILSGDRSPTGRPTLCRGPLSTGHVNPGVCSTARLQLPLTRGCPMSNDPFVDFKRKQRESWTTFAPTATFTTPVAAQLVRFAGIRAGESVLDVGTGTGVVAVTAARTGARVSALDLTPELLVEARENARIAGHPEITWQEGDAE